MYLKRMTLIVIIGIIVSFSIRAFGTVFPQIFMNMSVVRATIAIHTIFIVCHALFWLVLYPASQKTTGLPVDECAHALRMGVEKRVNASP